MKIPLLVILFIHLSVTSFSQSGSAQPNDFQKLVEDVAAGRTVSPKVLYKYSGFEAVKDTSLHYYEISVERIFCINDYVLGLITTLTTGVGMSMDIQTFSCDHKIIGELELSECSDHDQSSADFITKGYRLYADTLIEIIVSTEYVPDSTCLNKSGDFKEGCSFDTCTKKNETRVYYTISPLGDVNKLALDIVNGHAREFGFCSSRILTEKELQKYPKAVLRIMRNEIFASRGYRFQSPDLTDYFKAKEWYNPRKESVLEDLTIIEKINIDLIKQLEGK